MASIAGCGNNYRPVVTAINPVGPAAQPQKFAVAISNTGTTANPTAGLLTYVDFSGDTILITANVGVNPYYLILNAGGNTGFTLNSDRTLTSFDIDTTLLTSQVLQSTLPPNSCPLAIFPEGPSTYVTNSATNPGPCASTTGGPNAVFQFVSTPLNLQQQLTIDPAFSPIYTVGIASAPRVFAISQAVNGGPGQVSTIETASNTIDPNPITVGRGPVYGIMTGDATSAAKRAFILNQTDGTVSVINAQTNLLDIVPVGATNPITVGSNPLWADTAPVRNEIVVANAGDGVTAGSVSIISVPLCSATTQPNNPNCDINNPVDAVGFGTVLANVPTGLDTVMVSVLQDTTNSRAYVANSGDLTLPCALPPAVAGVSTVCSVSVVNLATNTVVQTIYALPDSQCGTTTICGHPAYIATSTGTPTGKVYVVSKDSHFMTVIRTDIDAVDTTVPLQGTGVSVRVSQP
jgi:hypothetical protein